MNKLNHVIAIEKGIKNRTLASITTLYHSAQKPAAFDGHAKSYKPSNESGENFPAENKRVELRAQDMLREAAKTLSELFDITAAKDIANCKALADVRLDGKVLLEKVPATYLLFLEKQLTDFHTFVSKLPTLDQAQEWNSDKATGLFRTAPFYTIKTKKVQKPLVLYPATDKHPAQTQLITEDETVGQWENVKLSGAIQESEKKALVEKIEKLTKAVKVAREEANDAQATEVAFGKVVFGWLLGPTN